VVEVAVELAPAPIALLYEKSDTPESVDPSIASLWLLSESKTNGNFLKQAAASSKVSGTRGLICSEVKTGRSCDCVK